jgi:hypothetical protein
MDLPKLLEDFARIFDDLGVPYVVMGGMVVRVYGIPRATYDLDFTVSISRDDLPRFYKEAERRGYTIPPEYLSGWVEQVAGMPLIHVRLYFKDKCIDVVFFLV